MPWKERELYLDALELAIEKGLYQRFLRYHLDTKSASLSHGTCAFSLWHRRYLLAIENMLRTLGPPEFVCITVPFWNIMDDYQYLLRTKAWMMRNQIPFAEDGACDSYETCSPILSDIGGRSSGGIALREILGVARRGSVVSGRPFGRVHDDAGRPGIVRADLRRTPLPPDCDQRAVLHQIASENDYESYVAKMEENIHDHVHNTVGGFMPTNASPVDFIFLSWHSTIDLFHLTWQQCHAATPDPDNFDFSATPESCARRDEGQENFPHVSAENPIYMRAGDDRVTDDPVIGRYFADRTTMTYRAVSDARTLHVEDRFDYDMPPAFRNLLASEQSCPNSTRIEKGQLEESDPMPIPAFRIEKWKSTPSHRTVEDWSFIARRKVDRHYLPQQADRRMAYFSCIVKSNGDLLSNEFLDDFLDEKVVREDCLDTLTPAPTAAPQTMTPAQIVHTGNDTRKVAIVSFVLTLAVMTVLLGLYQYCDSVPPSNTTKYQQVRGNIDSEGRNDEDNDVEELMVMAEIRGGDDNAAVLDDT